MKAIMMSIKPQHVANILNGIKTLEIRKRFPSDYVGWVYIYCTKDQNEELWWYDGTEDFRLYKKGIANEKDIGWHLQNGKVVARFWCDKVEKIKYHFGYYDMGEWAESYILEKSCLTAEELDNYLQASKEYDEKKVSKVYGYAIHITKLEIFDKPKEISEFGRMKSNFIGCENKCYKCEYHDIPCIGKHIKPLTRAPQSYQFIEI